MLEKKVCFKTVKSHLVSHADTPLWMCFSQFTVVISERWNQLCTAALFSFPTLPASKHVNRWDSSQSCMWYLALPH